MARRRAADRAGCDFLVDGGDHDYDNGRPSPVDALKRMAVTKHVSVGEFKIFRVGAGGPACDRLCVFHNRF